MEKIAESNEVASGDRKSVFIDDTPALLFRIDDSYYAVEDVCSHDGQPLTDGAVTDCSIQCPRHGARFDLKTGAALCMPATKPIAVFTVEVRDDGVWAEPA